ncbi:Mpp10 protein [Corynespora cassiicola Philippines]|uniref:Mpp10 protein n=1 Tax=Corynespora cassiicola Philippines TaxID=1448308 RepID=A0A2T2NT20_CORCC|nr:Mpp10 protein [Corynespora cassiicola Philippines]
MAPLSFSPDTSISSHTLSAGSAQPPPMDLPPQHPSQQLATASTTALFDRPAAFLQPSLALNRQFLHAAKQFLDPVAAGVHEAQARRLQEVRRKRKRGEDGGEIEDVRVLALKKVHTEGFGVGQVFEQARKIVEAAVGEIEIALPEEEGGNVVMREGGGESSEDEEEGFDEGEESESSLGEEGVDWEVASDQEGLEDEMYDGSDVSGDEDVDMEDGDEDMFSDEESDDEPAEEYVEDKEGLNDGFFNIDTFNKQSEFLEQQDQRGEAVDSEDEEIDWNADPMSAGAGKTMDDDVSDDESDEGGPTFGNVDLNAPEGDSEDDDDMLEEGDLDVDDGANANNIMYTDFFAPPARKTGKNSKKKGRPNPHNFPSANDPQNNKPDFDEDEMERTMGRVQRDLFEDDDDAESEEELSDLDPADPKSRRSTFERRQAKIMEEIRKLEAQNVAKRDWQLSGEVRAAERPENALLEEELDFEQTGKPMTVVTAEVSESIEELIKKRILAGEFDEVRRRRPDDLATGPRRGRFELDDTKSGKGLAELYEEDHLRQIDPNFVDAKDAKTKKEHDEIKALFTKTMAQLDSLSSFHFKPKPAAPNLEVRVDAPAIEMEDARPTAGGDVAGASMLAPQELYKPGEESANKTEVVTKGGLPIAREEMSREQKLRRRRRDKERSRKAGASSAATATPGEQRKKKQRDDKKQLLGDLKKGGVQVIGKRGKITDVEGKDVTKAEKKGAGALKL